MRRTVYLRLTVGPRTWGRRNVAATPALFLSVPLAEPAYQSPNTVSPRTPPFRRGRWSTCSRRKNHRAALTGGARPPDRPVACRGRSCRAAPGPGSRWRPARGGQTKVSRADQRVLQKLSRCGWRRSQGCPRGAARSCFGWCVSEAATAPVVAGRGVFRWPSGCCWLPCTTARTSRCGNSHRSSAAHLPPSAGSPSACDPCSRWSPRRGRYRAPTGYGSWTAP